MLVILISIFSAVIFVFALTPVFALSSESDKQIQKGNETAERLRNEFKRRGYKLDMDAYYDGVENYIKDKKNE